MNFQHWTATLTAAKAAGNFTITIGRWPKRTIRHLNRSLINDILVNKVVLNEFQLFLCLITSLSFQFRDSPPSCQEEKHLVALGWLDKVDWVSGSTPLTFLSRICSCDFQFITVFLFPWLPVNYQDLRIHLFIE